MSDELETIRPRLDALAPEALDEPQIPMAVYLQEAHDMLTWLATPANADQVHRVGLPPTVVADAVVALVVLRVYQSRWYTTWNGRKPDEQRQVEDEAQLLRDDAFAACRWNLRNDSGAMLVLDRIAEGQGVADLVADLEDLATLVLDRAAAFAGDATFDAPARAAELREKAQDVRSGLSEFRTDTSQRKAVDLRNRAFTYADGLLSQIREAGRYALRNRDELRFFQSQYQRQKRGRKPASPPADPATPA